MEGPVFITPKEASKRSGYCVDKLIEWMNRRDSPMPHVKEGRYYKVDSEYYLDWIRKEIGRGYGL